MSQDGQVTTPVTVTKFDSTTVKQQAAVIVQSSKTIRALQDSLERVVTQKTKVDPVYITRYRDTIKLVHDTLKFIPDLPSNIAEDSLIKLFPALKGRILIVPRAFYKGTKYYRMGGTVNNMGVNIDTLQVFNKTSVIIGQEGKWYQKKTIKTTIIQDNPYLSQSGSSTQSYYYKPKDKKFSIVVGPTALFDGHMRYGVGVTAGLKIY